MSQKDYRGLMRLISLRNSFGFMRLMDTAGDS